MNAYFKGGIVALVAMVAIFSWYKSKEPQLPANQSPPEFKIIDQMESVGVPDFSLERMDGSTFKLGDLRGKVVVLNFWASWCNPCVEEIPSMVKLVERTKGDVVVVAVSTDDSKEDILPFLKAFKVPKAGFEVVWDREKKIMNQYGVGKIPETFIIGPSFKLARKIVGTEDWGSDDAIKYFQMVKAGIGAVQSSPHSDAKSGR